MSDDEKKDGDDDQPPRVINMRDQEGLDWEMILTHMFPPPKDKKHTVDMTGYPDKVVITPADTSMLFQMHKTLERYNFLVKFNTNDGTIEMDTSEDIYPSMMEGLRRAMHAESQTEGMIDKLTGRDKRRHPRTGFEDRDRDNGLPEGPQKKHPRLGPGDDDEGPSNGGGRGRK